MTKRLLYLTGLLCLLLFASTRGTLQGKGNTPQSQNPTFHAHDAANVIDGSVHPELIPDRDAFRLFFLAASTSPSPTTEEMNRQHSLLSSAGFSEDERVAASTVLTEFKKQYDEAIQRYNGAVAAAQSPEQLPDTKKMVAELHALTAATQAKLEASTKDGGRLLLAHIQREKSRMKVAAE